MGTHIGNVERLRACDEGWNVLDLQKTGRVVGVGHESITTEYFRDITVVGPSRDYPNVSSLTDCRGWKGRSSSWSRHWDRAKKEKEAPR